VVYKAPFNLAVEEAGDAKIQDPTEVVILLTSTAIWWSDPHTDENYVCACK
jgi:glutathione-independent formaldehyde dehydrogenase